MGTSLKVTQGIVGSVFLASGGAKLAGGMQDDFERFGYPDWFRVMAGLVEVTAGTGLLAGLRDPRLAAPAGMLACGTMAGALYSHLVRAGDPPLKAAPAGILLGLAAWITTRQSSELQPVIRRLPTSPLREKLGRLIPAR